jgi:hypothetical protein
MSDVELGVLEPNDKSMDAATAMAAYPAIDFKAQIKQGLGERASAYDVDRFSLHFRQGDESNIATIFVPHK